MSGTRHRLLWSANWIFRWCAPSTPQWKLGDRRCCCWSRSPCPRNAASLGRRVSACPLKSQAQLSNTRVEGTHLDAPSRNIGHAILASAGPPRHLRCYGFRLHCPLLRCAVRACDRWQCGSRSASPSPAQEESPTLIDTMSTRACGLTWNAQIPMGQNHQE